jgi:CubicO group peptidase (beta-lactamase class C family)
MVARNVFGSKSRLFFGDVASVAKGLLAPQGTLSMGWRNSLVQDGISTTRSAPTRPLRLHGRAFTFAHLLSHTSGLPDVVEGDVGGIEFVSYSTEQLLANVKRQALLFPPGTGFQYSDAGLFLCQLITGKAGDAVVN